MRRNGLLQLVATALTVIPCLILNGCGGEPLIPQGKKKAVFIFCDVTGSLIEPESTQVAELAADILDRLPPDAAYKLLPVHMNTESAEAIMETNNTIVAKHGLNEFERESRREKLREEISKWYRIINAPERRPERTCLLGGLARAREFFSNLDVNQYEYELVFISDMIEHCPNTSMSGGRTINLQTQPPADALKLIGDAPLPDFSNARISIIVPGKNERSIERANQRPSNKTLNLFWSEVFRKCSNDKVSTDSWVTGTIPERIFQPQT